MARPSPTEWHVLGHDPLEPLAENLWRVEGDLPHGSLRRCMVVARLATGDLVLHSVIALDDDGMAALEALGRPAWMIVPNGWHRLDAARYKARYPDLKVLCPPGARKTVERAVAVDGTTEETPRPEPGDDAVSFELFGDGKMAEGVMMVRSADGVTAIFADSLFNVPERTGFSRFLQRLFGGRPGPQVTFLGRFFLTITGTRAHYRAWLEGASKRSDLVRLVPGHGAVVTKQASETLASVAATL